MSENPATTDKIEISEQKTRNYVLYGALIGLVILLQGIYTYLITSTGTEMRESTRTLHELVTMAKVSQVQLENVKEQVKDLQTAKKEAGDVHKAQDVRLQSIEQRLALHDQWIQAHNK